MNARLTQDPVLHFPTIVGSQVITRTSFFLSELMNHAGSRAQSPSSWQLLPSTHAFFVRRRTRARMRKESTALSDQASLGVWKVSIPSDAAQLAPSPGDLLARLHESLQHISLGHTWWPERRPLLETIIDKLPPEPRRQHRREHDLGVFQYNCESLRAPDRLYELLALAKRKGATIACLQGTLIDGGQ